MERMRFIQLLCLLPHQLLTNLLPIKSDLFSLFLLDFHVLSELFDIKFRGLFDSEVFFWSLFLRLFRVIVSDVHLWIVNHSDSQQNYIFYKKLTMRPRVQNSIQKAIQLLGFYFNFKFIQILFDFLLKFANPRYGQALFHLDSFLTFLNFLFFVKTSSACITLVVNVFKYALGILKLLQCHWERDSFLGLEDIQVLLSQLVVLLHIGNCILVMLLQ